MSILKALIVFACSLTSSFAATVSPLLARGYTVLPEPQRVKLRPADFQISSGWKVELAAGLNSDSIAVQTLQEKLALRGANNAPGVVHLEIKPGAVQAGPAQDADTDAIAAQAYQIELSPTRIRIVANAAPGLFYGVETLLQLVKQQDGALWLPEGEIVDWPDLRMRQIYWDDAHHLERLAELKRAVRQAAAFKVNGFAIKLEGHFQYEHAKALVEPQALAPAELQELTDYGLHYYVQVIPYLDSPGHIAFILKHPEYAGLRAFPDSNYELCATNPDSYKLLYGMFDDLLAANKGVQYFYLSTDEPYYIGMADNPQCREAGRAKDLGSVGKLLAEFTSKTANYLHDRGRTVVFWGESPLKPGDIPALPSHVVNGETYGHAFDVAFKARGIRQMIYTSTEGEEKMFPQYFMRPPSRRIHPERDTSERVLEATSKIASDSARQDSDLIGALVAGWADMGLHPETFWLGYATISAAAWNPRGPEPHEAMGVFYPLFYGPRVQGLDQIYRLMSYQAQLWTDTWDTADSAARKPIWGNSTGFFKPPHPAHDQTLPLPAAPSPADLGYPATWVRDNVRRVRAAEEGLPENDELLGLLNTNLRLATSNRYSLEVFLSIAQLFRQNIEMLIALHHIDAALAAAQSAASKQDHTRAVAAIDQALALAREIRTRRNSVLRDATATWYQSWLPRVDEANGRRFLHELDDVKDHLPDRTVGMDYLVYRELLLPLGEWYGQAEAARNRYAQAHGLPAQTQPLRWNETAQ